MNTMKKKTIVVITLNLTEHVVIHKLRMNIDPKKGQDYTTLELLTHDFISVGRNLHHKKKFMYGFED